MLVFGTEFQEAVLTRFKDTVPTWLIVISKTVDYEIFIIKTRHEHPVRPGAGTRTTVLHPFAEENWFHDFKVEFNFTRYSTFYREIKQSFTATVSRFHLILFYQRE